MPATMEAPATVRARKAIMWTRADCRALADTGLLPARWELVQGEIVSKMGTNLPHARISKLMDVWLSSVFPTDHILPTCSIDVAPEDNPTSEPEPDITVLNRSAGELTQNPQPADIALLVEISDSTLDHDLGPKAQLYSRAGIVEYWVVDLKGRRLVAHRDPGPDGYTSLRTWEATESLSPLAQPAATLSLALLFG
ncbi:MAG: Uma2 family endonuclease [Bryobacteraceae bacterium]|nr:Uma2 family endonuclease [Bryobacteraceae bacterium]